MEVEDDDGKGVEEVADGWERAWRLGEGVIEVVDDDAHVEGEGEGFGEGARVREGRSSGRNGG